MNQVSFEHTHLTGGFWKQKQDLVRNVTVKAVFDRFTETGRFRAFKCDWKEGMADKPHHFWDSDVAKWIEGASYILMEKRDSELEAIIEGVIDEIEKNARPDGYFNIYYIVVEPGVRFQKQTYHELYCAGHLMEAAIAYAKATGRERFLKLMCRYADCIDKHFRTLKDTEFPVPGHEEIELALVRLWEYTGNERYLQLSKYFLDTRGVEGEKRAVNQTDIPLRELIEARGHAVRAGYLYCAMADIARICKDTEMADACRRVFENIVNKRMYITGGIGSSYSGEAFTLDYDLPNLFAYAETCAALSLSLFAHRMLLIEPDSRYADTVERVIYNGFLSGLSLSGDAFFYENPLALLPRAAKRDVNSEKKGLHMPLSRRQKVFNCSCCPPNVVRFIPSIANFIYTADEKTNTVYIHQFMASESSFPFGDGNVSFKIETDYPWNGKVEIHYHGAPINLAVRIPGWCVGDYGKTIRGYSVTEVKDGETLTFDFPMIPTVFEANPEIEADGGRVAIMRGPLVYCAEEADNGKSLSDLRICQDGEFTEEKDYTLGVITLTHDATRRLPFPQGVLYRPATGERKRVSLKLIPYYAFANRSDGEMQVFINTD